jgi:glycosyltransferase involved in cell wall biosynthesis
VRTGVVIPVHGFAPYLVEALDAVLANAPDEVVVVDDGSPVPVGVPDTVRLVRREHAGGPAVARAAGLDALGDAAELVALCDADDAWLPGHLDAMRAALTAGAGWAFSRALIVGPDGRPTGERWQRPVPGLHDAQSLYASNPVPTSSVVLRADALQAAGGFPGPVRVAEDWELWLRLCAAGHDGLCVEGPGIRYRRHPEGLTADVAALAQAQLAVHERHAGLVDPATAKAAVAADRAALRRERLRRRIRALPGGALVTRRRDAYRA